MGLSQLFSALKPVSAWEKKRGARKALTAAQRRHRLLMARRRRGRLRAGATLPLRGAPLAQELASAPVAAQPSS